MNGFNRVVMILLILVLFVVLTVALVIPTESLALIKGVVDGSLHTMGRIRPEFVLPFRALLILVAVLLDVLLLSLLIFEVRGPARRTIRVRGINGGMVSVTSQSLAERLAYHLDQLADVVSVKVKPYPRRDGVDLDLDVRTGADVNIPEKAAQVLEVTRQVVEERMGLKLAGKPRVSIHAMTYPGAPVRPLPEPAERRRPGEPLPPPSV